MTRKYIYGIQSLCTIVRSLPVCLIPPSFLLPKLDGPTQEVTSLPREVNSLHRTVTALQTPTLVLLHKRVKTLAISQSLSLHGWSHFCWERSHFLCVVIELFLRANLLGVISLWSKVTIIHTHIIKKYKKNYEYVVILTVKLFYPILCMCIYILVSQEAGSTAGTWLS